MFPCSKRSPNSAVPRWKGQLERTEPEVLLALGILAPLTFGVLAAFRFFFIMGHWAVIPSLVGVILVGDLILLVVLLGEAYEKMDHSVKGLLGY